jgi:hypothetical protein
MDDLTDEEPRERGMPKAWWMQGPEAQKAAADRFARDLLPVIEEIRISGITTQTGIAAQLRARGIRTVRGGKWTATSVRNLLARITR